MYTYSYVDFVEYEKLTNSLNNNTVCNEAGGSLNGHPKFGFAMLGPVLVVTLFMFIQWWNEEKYTSRKNKIFTFILVIFQIWPQYKMLNVLYIGFRKNDPKWKEQKEKLLKNVYSLGNKIYSKSLNIGTRVSKNFKKSN